MWIAPACLHTHIYDILSYAHSHVNSSIYTQEVQKRGYFVLGIICATTKQKKFMFQKNLKLDLRIATELETITLLLPNHIWLRQELLSKNNQQPFVLYFKVYLLNNVAKNTIL